MDKGMEALLTKADTFTLITIDNRGFPHAIAVSPPLERNGFTISSFISMVTVEQQRIFDKIVVAVSFVLTKKNTRVSL